MGAARKGGASLLPRIFRGQVSTYHDGAKPFILKRF